MQAKQRIARAGRWWRQRCAHLFTLPYYLIDRRVAGGGSRRVIPAVSDRSWPLLETLEDRRLLAGLSVDAAQDFVTVNAAAASVADRHIFYNNSAFDGNDVGANANDDNAIAPAAAGIGLGKTALLPGHAATFQHYTSYSRGINGIMIDIAGLANPPGIDAGDFVFRVGNTNDPASWTLAPSPQAVTVRENAGTGGSDRVTVTWADNAIEQQWLQVTAPASSPDIGLAADEIHYWGNQIGETGNQAGSTAVNALDAGEVVNHPTGFTPAGVENPYDIDRSDSVNALDAGVAVNHPTGFTSLLLFTPPGGPPPPTTGEINGTVWDDANADRVRDIGESRLEGWQVYLDQNQNGQLDSTELSTQTDADGRYTFSDLDAGQYVVAEILPEGWKQTSPAAPLTPPEGVPPDPHASAVTLLSQIPLADFGDGSGSANDITSYVSPSGREYAIIGLAKSIAFVEVTDPTNPRVVDVLPGPDEVPSAAQGNLAALCHDECDPDGGQASSWRDMKVFDHYAYTTNETGGGLQVIDLENIDGGSVTEVHVDDSIAITSHNVAVNPDSGFLYLTGSNSRNGGLVVYDLNANPAVPQFAGAWSERYLHDAVVLTYETGPYAGRELVYGFAENEGVKVIDVTDKSNMVTLATIAYPNTTYAHFGALSADMRYLFVNDELDEINNANVASTTTYVLDVQDPGNPQFVTSITNGNTAVDHNPMIRGDLLFEANYRSGLRIYNVQDVMNAHEVAYYDTYPADDLPEFSGAWGVDASLPSEIVLVSDIQGGLFVLDAARAKGPLGTYLVDVGPGDTITNVDFGNRNATAAIDFDDFTIGPYAGGQDVTGPVTVEDGGTTLHLEGNRWKQINLSHDVVPETVLEFDFKSISQGELQGVGLDEDLDYSADRTFQLYGTQSWGIQDFNNYAGSAPNYKHYQIPVGQYFTGPMNYLFFANDHDVANPTGDSFFSKVRLYETVAITPINDPPTAIDDFLRVDADSGPQVLDVLVNDGTLPDVGETVTITSHTGGSDGGTVIVEGGASITYTPAVGFVGTETFDYTINDGTPGNDATATVSVMVGPSEYDIEIVFIDNSLTASQQAVFTTAAQRWSEIIVGDVPDVVVAGVGLVDDVRIEASAPFIDGPGGTLGQAGPTAFRNTSLLPAKGMMRFDSADIANLESTGGLLEVILHEMGHVFGIGTLWNNLGLLSGGGTSDPRFSGPLATAEYNAIFGLAEASVPVANTGGDGTRDSHWRESVFDNELMTGYLDSGSNPLSRVTAASLVDLGYVIDVSAADALTSSATQPGTTAPIDAGLPDDFPHGNADHTSFVIRRKTVDIALESMYGLAAASYHRDRTDRTPSADDAQRQVTNEIFGSLDSRSWPTPLSPDNQIGQLHALRQINGQTNGLLPAVVLRRQSTSKFA